jgi:hypothetical protein
MDFVRMTFRICKHVMLVIMIIFVGRECEPVLPSWVLNIPLFVSVRQQLFRLHFACKDQGICDLRREFHVKLLYIKHSKACRVHITSHGIQGQVTME